MSDSTAPAAVEAVIPVPSTLTLTQVKSAVLEALSRRRWIAQDAGDGKISATYTRGNMALALAITYGSKEVKVSVAQWDGRPRVQKTQERWFANAKKDIADELVRQAVLTK